MEDPSGEGDIHTANTVKKDMLLFLRNYHEVECKTFQVEGFVSSPPLCLALVKIHYFLLFCFLKWVKFARKSENTKAGESLLYMS